ncbi:hypothetical protein L3Q82_026797 [Scortum barcoo]|uniref:Uncharacterized protein n=1 Tax=Scortum barcoo TaxID=214431 RepID=A0ACB8WJT6_9TELE|nr:hypothetical protein L3Q82_026797 [Scortum barcoo]
MKGGPNPPTFPTTKHGRASRTAQLCLCPLSKVLTTCSWDGGMERMEGRDEREEPHLTCMYCMRCLKSCGTNRQTEPVDPDSTAVSGSPQVYSVDSDETGASVEFLVPRDLADGFVNNKRECYKFRFQKVFDHAVKQEEIFENIAKPVADSVLAGYNGTIFAYGQTGSGKTFTITGGAERYSDRGIIPRTLSYLFERFSQESSIVYTTHISYLEIYNEVGYDLLDSRHEASRLEDLPKVMIMEDPDQNIHLKNLSLQQSSNEEEALNLLFLGDTNRMIAETPMNQASTRSHCIFTVHLCRREPGSATLRRSKLHLVDLAGSDRVSKTGLNGQLLTEAKYINLSLHYLEQVIIALSEKNRSHIPYRNSMLTSVLRDSLGGNCMTTMIATMAVDKRNLDESISTCRFAQRVALIKNEALLNEELDPALLIARLKREIQSLKEELAMVTGQQRDDQLTVAEIQQLEELVKVFLNDPDPDVTLSLGPDMRKIQYCFSILKIIIRDKQGRGNVHSDGQESPAATVREEHRSAEEVIKLKEMLMQRDNEINVKHWFSHDANHRNIFSTLLHIHVVFFNRWGRTINRLDRNRVQETEFRSRTAVGKKLFRNLVVLVRALLYRFPEGRRVKSLCAG